MIYECPYDDCTLHGVTREIDDGDEALAADDPRRLCSGTVNVEQDDNGETVLVSRPCLRPMDAISVDGTISHVDAQLPDLPPPPDQPPPEPVVATAANVDQAAAAVRNATLADANIAPEAVQPTIEAMLTEAKDAIQFFEQYAGKGDAAALAAYKALDQETKDHIAFTLIRGFPLVVRYLAADLPTS